MKMIKRSDVANINTTFCITHDELNYFGDSRAKIPVYDGASPLLEYLGTTDGPVMSGQVASGGFAGTPSTGYADRDGFGFFSYQSLAGAATAYWFGSYTAIA